MANTTFKDSMNALASGSQILRELSDDEQARLKSCLLDMFQDLYAVCEKHDLTIMMTGGSTLGSVRHRGFIPWDDDLDLTMPREDYEKLKLDFEEELGDRYILCAPNYRTKSKTRFPKIMKKGTEMKELYDINSDMPCGVFLDIFILENIPQNRIHQKLKGLLCNALMFGGSCTYWYEHRCSEIQEYMCRTESGRKMYNRQMGFGWLCHFIPSWVWFNLTDKAIRYHKETGLKGIPTGRKHYFGEILPTHAYLPVSFGDFENMRVPLPGNYDICLRNLYGDYMQIPPPEKRERHLVVSLNLHKK